jgi:hypothetical protein
MPTKSTKRKRSGSLAEAFRGLHGVTLSLYRLFPAAAVSFLVLILFFGFIISKSELAAQATALALVLLASAAIFLRTHSYTEAFLALIVGLLPALSMDWSPARFWVFVGGYGLLTAFAFLASSVRIAKDAESIYVQAAVFAEREDKTVTAKRLEALARSANTPLLGPIERGECVRQLMFRNFPITLVPDALRSIEKLSVITSLPPAQIASYVVILYPVAGATGTTFAHLDDCFYLALRDSAATPEEFIEAFRVTRSLVLSGRMDLSTYLQKLSTLLGFGLAPDEIRKRMEVE